MAFVMWTILTMDSYMINRHSKVIVKIAEHKKHIVKVIILYGLNMLVNKFEITGSVEY